jgi:hypothetical protein
MKTVRAQVDGGEHVGHDMTAAHHTAIILTLKMKIRSRKWSWRSGYE